MMTSRMADTAPPRGKQRYSIRNTLDAFPRIRNHGDNLWRAARGWAGDVAEGNARSGHPWPDLPDARLTASGSPCLRPARDSPQPRPPPPPAPVAAGAPPSSPAPPPRPARDPPQPRPPPTPARLAAGAPSSSSAAAVRLARSPRSSPGEDSVQGGCTPARRQARSALDRLCREALRAGKKPPTRPRTAENTIPWRRIAEVIRNWNAISENDRKFGVLEVMPFIGSASTQPTRPPITEMITDSTTNDSMTAPGPKPSTRSRASSRVRAPIEAYIVFAAPNTAPTAMMTVMNVPTTVMIRVNISLCAE